MSSLLRLRYLILTSSVGGSYLFHKVKSFDLHSNQKTKFIS